jgi:hypothetical protein
MIAAISVQMHRFVDPGAIMHSAPLLDLCRRILCIAEDILRPGLVGCFTSANPVPLQASHFRSDGGEDVFLIRLPPNEALPQHAADARIFC